jgi:hypothetical protein
MCDEDVAAIVIDNGSGKNLNNRKKNFFFEVGFYFNRYVQSWLCR